MNECCCHAHQQGLASFSLSIMKYIAFFIMTEFLIFSIWDHPFGPYAKFFKKLTFLTH